MNQGRIIVALSGGKASAYCADYAFKNYPKEKIILYFNDTKWEHPDLYRFLNDLENYFDHPIINDSDGRSPEDLFIAEKMLANNRVPFCSRILKAERLQSYYQQDDILLFGIGLDESHRSVRIAHVYMEHSLRKKKRCYVKFPLLIDKVPSDRINDFVLSTGIREPVLYTLGFSHNNCSGGCVRAGKKQWKNLYESLPEVYAERERVENKLRNMTGKDIHFFKDETLSSFRLRIERGELSAYYYTKTPLKQINECVGICHTQN